MSGHLTQLVTKTMNYKIKAGSKQIHFSFNIVEDPLRGKGGGISTKLIFYKIV